jgi:hypothetical protein
MALLLTKLLLAPAFVVAASLIARRHGPRVGGLIAGLPVVAGPILLAYALAHGRSFAAAAAVGTMLGLVSLMIFVVVYAHMAAHTPWVLSMLGGWLGFALATAAFRSVSVPAGAALAIAAGGLVAGLMLLPRGSGSASERAPAPRWDLPMRAVCAVALVLALTAAAGWLGPRLSGLLAPFPVIATVLATFTHAQHGPEEVRRLLRWLLGGYGAFALFCFVLASSVRSFGTVPAFLLAAGVSVLAQGAVIVVLARRSRESGSAVVPPPLAERA